MQNILKVAAACAAFAIAGAAPLTAQIDNGIDFTARSSFYAGSAKMPAGAYRITEDGWNAGYVLVRSIDGSHSAIVNVMPTLSGEPREQTAVSFIKYGDVEYLDHIWVEGERDGLKVDPTKAERKAALAAASSQTAVSGN